jgi:antitoxin ParD1/3/4
VANRTTLNVSLTPPLQKLVDDQVASGRYGSASEVVREGLRLIDERDRRLALDELRAKVDLGWQQSERGEGRDGEAVFAALRAQLQPKRRGREAAKARTKARS